MATAKAQGVVLELSNNEARALLSLLRDFRQQASRERFLEFPGVPDIEDALLSEIGAYECE